MQYILLAKEVGNQRPRAFYKFEKRSRQIQLSLRNNINYIIFGNSAYNTYYANNQENNYINQDKLYKPVILLLKIVLKLLNQIHINKTYSFYAASILLV